MSGVPPEVARRAVTALLRSIESRDLRAIARHLSPQVSWQNVPHLAVRGRTGVVALLAGIVTWSDEVRWDVVSSHYDERRAWLERVDRFRIDGEWYDVRCNGVFEVDETALVTAVRDYVDLGEWRERVQPVLARLAARPPLEVVERHLAAVRSGNAVAMAADYAVDAVLVRGPQRHAGWAAIADYFEQVPDRLGPRMVVFEGARQAGVGIVETQWSIAADGELRAVGGVDTFVVRDGRIVHQTVELHGEDF